MYSLKTLAENTDEKIQPLADEGKTFYTMRYETELTETLILEIESMKFEIARLKMDYSRQGKNHFSSRNHYRSKTIQVNTDL